jgi:trigger factor
LKVTSEQLEHRRVAVTIEVEEERVQRALRATARSISRRSPIPGFRPGRAPLGVVMRRLGKETLYDALVDDMGETLYEEALEQLDIKPVAQAQLDDVQLEPLVLKLTVPIEPIVELGEFRDLRLEPPVVSISDEEVEESLAELQEQNVRWELVTRPSQLDDMVSAALQGTTSDGETVIDEERASLRLSLDSPLPTLHEQLLDMEVDEEREFDFTYPQNFASPELAGQTLRFRARLLETRERVLPELDDEWAKTVGDYASLEDLRLSLRERLEGQAERESERDYSGQVVETLVDQAEIDYPEEMVQRVLDRILFEENMALQRQGLNLDLFLRMEGKTREQLREERHEEAETRLRRSLVLGKVAELLEVEVSPVEVISYIRLVSSAYGDQAEEMRRTMLASEPFQESVRQDLLADKATGRLVSIAKGEVEVAEAAADTPESPLEEQEPEPAEAVEAAEADEARGEVEVVEEAMEIPGSAAEEQKSKPAEAVEAAEADKARGEVEGAEEATGIPESAAVEQESEPAEAVEAAEADEAENEEPDDESSAVEE